MRAIAGGCFFNDAWSKLFQSTHGKSLNHHQRLPPAPGACTMLPCHMAQFSWCKTDFPPLHPLQRLHKTLFAPNYTPLHQWGQAANITQSEHLKPSGSFVAPGPLLGPLYLGRQAMPDDDDCPHIKLRSWQSSENSPTTRTWMRLS